MNQPVKFSATQIKKFASCQRVWGWEYLEGIRPAQGEAAALGGRCHTVLEQWLQSGVVPDPKSKEGKIVMPGLKLLPTPHSSLEVEREFVFELSGHLYRGFVDLGYWSKEGLWVVHDHKTTGDFMWALTEEELHHDVQAILYAKEAIDRHDQDAVILSWLYMRTRGKAIAESRVTTIQRAEIDSGMEVIQQYADEMSAFRKKLLPVVQERGQLHQPGDSSVVLDHLEPNAYACSAFRGCPFQDRCNLSRKERMRSIMAQDSKKTTLKERMAARKAKRGADGASGGGPKAVAQVPTPAINPPEQPSSDVATAPLTPETKTEDKAANEGTTTKPKPKRGRGRPRKEKEDTVSPDVSDDTSGKFSSDGFHQMAFAKIFEAAVAGGDDRHMAAAEKAWAIYKKEFLG